MTQPSTAATPSRKLLDVTKIYAVLDAEKHLIHGALIESLAPDESTDEWRARTDDETLPQPGPLALANCENVGHCAMGALIFATGKVSFKRLDSLDGEATQWPLDIVKSLYDDYGVQRWHAQQIIEANDQISVDNQPETITRRRERVKERVAALAGMQEREPERDLLKCRDYEADSAGSFHPVRENHFAALDLGEPEPYDFDWD